jgi:hypothetical protein
LSYTSKANCTLHVVVISRTTIKDRNCTGNLLPLICKLIELGSPMMNKSWNHCLLMSPFSLGKKRNKLLFFSRWRWREDDELMIDFSALHFIVQTTERPSLFLNSSSLWLTSTWQIVCIPRCKQNGDGGTDRPAWKIHKSTTESGSNRAHGRQQILRAFSFLLFTWKIPFVLLGRAGRMDIYGMMMGW